VVSSLRGVGRLSPSVATATLPASVPVALMPRSRVLGAAALRRGGSAARSRRVGGGFPHPKNVLFYYNNVHDWLATPDIILDKYIFLLI
jgi:hypothetical protein